MEIVKIQIHPSNLKALVVGNKTFRSAYDFHLSEVDLEKSCRELKETDEVRNASLNKLKEMLSRDEDMRYRTDDAYLLRYLRYRKFDYKAAYSSIRHFYVTRKEYPDIFYLQRNLESLLNWKIGNLMPYTDEEGSLIFILKYGKWKTEEINIRDLMLMCNLASDILSMNPRIQVNGLISIWDFAELTLSQVSQILQPVTLKLWMKILQELYPWRIKRILLFNCSTLQYTAFRAIRYILKKKIADRITPLRSDPSQLHEYVNPALLPKEYGGNLEDNECYSYMTPPILDNLRYLEYENSFISVKKL